MLLLFFCVSLGLLKFQPSCSFRFVYLVPITVYVYMTHFGAYSSIGVSLYIQSIFISSRFNLFRVNSESMSFGVTLLRLVRFFTFSWLLSFLVFAWHDRFPGVLAAKRHFIFDRFCGLKIQQDSQSSLQFIINI